MKDQLTIERISLAAVDNEQGDLVQFRQNLGDVDALAASIREHGLVSPPVVWRANRRRVEGTDAGARYVVIDGSRRIAAIRQLERAWSRTDKPFPLTNLFCSVHEGRVDAARLLSVQVHVERDLVEDTNRGDEAVAVKWLLQTGWDPMQIQEMLGVSQAWVSQLKALAERLTSSSMAALQAGKISMQDALSLTRLSKAGVIVDAARQNAELEVLVARNATRTWQSARAKGVAGRPHK